MRISTKCSIALHLLLVMAVNSDSKFTSERLAMSTGCNPVIVRNTLGKLKRAGYIAVQRGTGGAYLVADPANISVWSVFQAVDTLDDLIGLHPSPAQVCPVGEIIGELLEKPYEMVETAIQTAMESYTLQQLVDDYYEKRQGTVPEVPEGFDSNFGISKIR